jgi:hypothetical protein
MLYYPTKFFLVNTVVQVILFLLNGKQFVSELSKIAQIMLLSHKTHYYDKHQANEFLMQNAKNRETLFAWILKAVEIEINPKRYTFSTGSWCKTS